MINARNRGNIDDMYHVEDATPCDFVTMAGFMGNNPNNDDSDENDENGVVYPPNKEKVWKLCGDKTNNDEYDNEDKKNYKNDDDDAKKVIKSTRTRYNKGQIVLEFDDLLGGKHDRSVTETDHPIDKGSKVLKMHYSRA